MYGFNVQLKRKSPRFEDAVARVTDALKTEGFGVLTDIDVQKTTAICNQPSGVPAGPESAR